VRSARDARRLRLVLAPAAVEQRRDHGGQRGRVELGPQAFAQALRDDDVVLRVQRAHRLAQRGHVRVLALTREIAEAAQYGAATVEDGRDGARRAADLPHQPVLVAQGLEVALSPSGVGLAIGALVARMGADTGAQLLDLGVGALAGPLAVLLAACRAHGVAALEPARLQDGGELLAAAGAAIVELARNGEPSRDVEPVVEVGDG